MISPLSKTLVNFVILSVFIITSFLTTPVTVSSPRDHNFNNLVAQELISDYDFYNQSLTAKSIENFLLNQPSTLKNKQSAMGGVSVPIYQAIVDASISNKSTINSKILICLLEIKYYLLSSPSPSEYALTHPLGLNNIDGFHPQLIYIANAMEEAYINYSVPSSRIVSLADNTNISLESSPNAGTFAIQSALAIMSQNEEDFYHLLTKKNNSFIATYNRYFSSKDGVAQRSQIMSTATPFLYRPLSGNPTPGSFFDHNSMRYQLRRFDGITNFSYDNHKGTDYPRPPGSRTPILASATGTIETVRINYVEANYVLWCPVQQYTPLTAIVIRHTINGEQYQTLYWHMAPGAIATNPRTGQLFQPNDAVVQGEVIGYSGDTGCSEGEHLHFEVRRAGNSVDAYGWCGQGSDPWPYKSDVLWVEQFSNPAPCKTTIYRGQYVAQSYGNVMMAGSTQTVQVQVKNTGTVAWDNNTKIAPIPRDQSSPFYDPATWESDKRITSAGIVAPGETKTFEFSLRAPANPGQYNIQFGFLQEAVTWFGEPSDGMIYFPIDVRFAVGAGSSRQQFFVDAYNRNGSSARLGFPIAPATWSGLDMDTQRAVIQGLDSGAVILHNEQSDIPSNTVPAYVLSGQLLQHFRNLDGSRSWLGTGPTSDHFTNSVGQLQSNFPNGYIVTDGSTAQAVAWPKPVEGQWHAEYHNGKNLNAGATWVQNEASIDYNWGEEAPGESHWGVWADDFSVRWTGPFSFAQGKYTFIAGADDRLRVWIDDKLMLDAWEQTPPYSQHIFSTNMTSGTHAIRVEYGENFGSGAIKFIWKQNTYNVFLPIAVQ